jgi:prepilin-type N-terminal cleavage/methylation domain-containing protein
MNTTQHQKGFTLIEILIALSILTLLCGGALAVSMDMLHHDSFADIESNLVTALQSAREQAMNNTCIAHTCPAGAYHIVPLGASVALTGPTDIIFSPLSGNAITIPPNMWEIILKDDTGHRATTTISSSGKITYVQK